jgi:hypothetical protein
MVLFNTFHDEWCNISWSKVDCTVGSVFVYYVLFLLISDLAFFFFFFFGLLGVYIMVEERPELGHDSYYGAATWTE